MLLYIWAIETTGSRKCKYEKEIFVEYDLHKWGVKKLCLIIMSLLPLIPWVLDLNIINKYLNK